MKRILLLVPLVACGSADEGGLAPGTRLVTGRITVSGGGPAQRPAVQLVGVYAAQTCGGGAVKVGMAGAGVTSCAIFGTPFDPGLGEPARLLLPCGVTVNVLVQTVSSSGGATPGERLAVLAFPTGIGETTTTLLAREPMCRDTAKLATNVLDLGTFTVPAAAPASMIVVGGPAGGTNPLATVDTDQDTMPNVADGDDDGDGMEDMMDADDDGDGMADAAQVVGEGWFE